LSPPSPAVVAWWSGSSAHPFFRGIIQRFCNLAVLVPLRGREVSQLPSTSSPSVSHAIGPRQDRRGTDEKAPFVLVRSVLLRPPLRQAVLPPRPSLEHSAVMSSQAKRLCDICKPPPTGICDFHSDRNEASPLLTFCARFPVTKPIRQGDRGYDKVKLQHCRSVYDVTSMS
jgi:hypothetical protein